MYHAVSPKRSLGIVRDQHDCLAALLHGLERVEYHLTGCGIQVAGWLVGKNDRRVVYQRTSNSYALHLTTGKLIGLVLVVLLGQANRTQCLPST